MNTCREYLLVAHLLLFCFVFVILVYAFFDPCTRNAADENDAGTTISGSGVTIIIYNTLI